MDSDLKSLDVATGKPPTCRILNAASLNAVVKKIADADQGSALARQDVQAMLDGKPPYDPAYLANTGQDGRCNLNFGDGKARIKSEMAGYYDLTDSVPTLALVLTDHGAPNDPQRAYWNAVMSEEFHRLLKDWKSFDHYHQLLVQRFVSHGLGFLYFKDDVDWRWDCAGLEEFKIPRNTTLNEDEIDIACTFREVTIGKLWSWIKDVADDDHRWNKKEVREAILKAADTNITAYADGAWEHWQAILKNNDLFASSTAQDIVRIAHVWVREFSGKVSHYITLRNGGNADFLYKCENRFSCVNECFTFFPYEIGTNGLVHSIRGKAHEIYASVQVLNTLRCQTVDNARLSGSLLLQPATEMDAEDMALLFYAGATYIPAGVKVQNGQLNNPSQSILPIIRDMTMLMNYNTGDSAASSTERAPEKTKFEIQAELTKEAVLPTASMNLFYQPWGRHLTEVWRRVSNKDLRKEDPGAGPVFEMRKRIEERGVPKEAIFKATRVMPVRAIGYGSASARLLALDEFMQYYGSLDPVGQNNLLRDRFAQKVGYGQVDRYVPQIEANGRLPVDKEIAELQNIAMSQGAVMTVAPNDHHIIHIETHLPSLTEDLEYLESGQGTPQLLASAQNKSQHIAGHLKLLKPDKLNEKIVAELIRQYNNASQRVDAATDAMQKQQERELADRLQQGDEAMQQGQAESPATSKAREMAAEGEVRRQQMVADSELKRELARAEFEQKAALEDAKTAREMRRGAPVVPGLPPPAPIAPLPAPIAPLPAPIAPPAEPGVV